MTKPGIRTITDLYRRSIVDPYSGCWHWQGAKRSDGVPSIWTFDYTQKRHRTMAGPRAVWQIANKAAPTGLVYRCCARDCVKPAHMRIASDRAAMVRAQMAGGKWATDAMQAARIENLRKARAARGIVDTPAELVLAVRNADPQEEGRQIARRLGLCENVVSSIRRGLSRVEVYAGGGGE